MTAPEATVLITTRNRKEDLRQAIRSALAQSGDVEVLVVDDASEDGTADAVRAEFPEVRLLASGSPLGLVAQRNRGVREARAPVVFCIDDDAALTSDDIVRTTLAELAPARVGAVAIPVLEPGAEPAAAPDGRVHVVAAFVGTAHALRRDLFLALGGYRAALFRQGEESDYCIRMLDAGYVTRLGASAPIRHFRSPARDERAWHRYGARNAVLYAWQNVPMPYLPGRLAAASAGALVHGARIGRLGDKIVGLLQAYAAILGRRARRRPVSRRTHALNRKLRRRGSVLLDEIERGLPPLRT